MKYILVIWSLFVGVGLVWSQETQQKKRKLKDINSYSNTVNSGKTIKYLYLTGGKTFSTFLYSDSLGNTDKDLTYANGQSFGIGMAFVIKDKHTIRPEIHYSELGANSRFLSSDVQWRLYYLGTNTAYLFRAIHKKKYSFSPGLSIGFDYMVSGKQSVGDQRYDLIENNSLKKWDVTAGVILNNNVQITETFSIMFEYRCNIGLNQIENLDVNESTRNIAHRALLGLSFKL